MKHPFYTQYPEKQVLQGKKPWKDSMPECEKCRPKKYGGIDGPARINQCLSCKRPECINCIDKIPTKMKKVELIPASFLFDALSGIGIAKLSREYHISTNTVYRWLEALGIEKIHLK